MITQEKKKFNTQLILCDVNGKGKNPRVLHISIIAFYVTLVWQMASNIALLHYIHKASSLSLSRAVLFKPRIIHILWCIALSEKGITPSMKYIQFVSMEALNPNGSGHVWQF